MSREVAFSALFERVCAAYDWALTSRRLKLWSEVPPAQRPALFLLESGPESYQWTSLATPRRSFDAKLLLYFNSRDPSRPGACALNEALDALDLALLPAGRDQSHGRQTLQGAVYDCRIVGVPIRDSGDLDGDGLAVVNIRLVAP